MDYLCDDGLFRFCIEVKRKRRSINMRVGLIDCFVIFKVERVRLFFVERLSGLWVGKVRMVMCKFVIVSGNFIEGVGFEKECGEKRRVVVLRLRYRVRRVFG